STAAEEAHHGLLARPGRRPHLLPRSEPCPAGTLAHELALARRAFRERERDCERDERSESRQPAMLLLHLPGGTRDARESHRQLLAEPVDRVVRSRRLDGFERKIRPLRKLRGDQPADERSIDVHLVAIP